MERLTLGTLMVPQLFVKHETRPISLRLTRFLFLATADRQALSSLIA